MALLLRIDVDKPYGHHHPAARLASKLAEDFSWSFHRWLPYLHHCHAMIRWLTERDVTAFFYFRNCTAPTPATLDLLQQGGHRLGFHAENTRTEASFRAELQAFEQQTAQRVQHFTKHGSGRLKLGRYHYAPYEPDRYRDWAQQLGIGYFSGNGMAATPDDLQGRHGFWPNAFWMERAYRLPGCSQLTQLLEVAQQHPVMVLTHPENFYTHQTLRDDLQMLITEAKNRRINWLQTTP